MMTGESIVGIIGRSTKDYRMPKFLFYPTGFDKRYYFYNYHRAIKELKKLHALLQKDKAMFGKYTKQEFRMQ